MLAESLFLIGPFGVLCLGLYVLRRSLRDNSIHAKLLFGTAIIIFASIGYFLFWLAEGGQMATVFSLIFAVIMSIIILVAGIWILITVPKWHKLIGLMICIAITLAFFNMMLFGSEQTPERLTENNGDLIVQALEKYHSTHGTYPQELEMLTPDFLSPIPEALTTQGTGWLYTSNSNNYTLGYWHYPRKYGVTLCLNISSRSDWECQYTEEEKGWKPFDPVPTPSSNFQSQ